MDKDCRIGFLLSQDESTKLLAVCKVFKLPPDQAVMHAVRTLYKEYILENHVNR